jgi:aldehyde dehydrogenase (NAD+)
MDTINPATEEAIVAVSNARAAEVDQAVDAARSAFYGGEWSTLSGYERGILLNKLANLIEENADELAMLESLDNGKPVGEARAADLNLVIQCYRYYAGWADKIHGQVVNPGGPFGKGTFGYIEKEPVGVVGQIIPWNFPLLMQAWKIGPAVATGCSTVIKLAPQTPLSGLRVGELIQEAGFPAGAINIIPGDDETGILISKHDGFDKIAFTGSTAVGRAIMADQAHSTNMKRVTLELGGKSPAVVMEDADMENAVASLHTGLFLNQGQCCCAGSRIFVHEKVYDEFVEKSAEMAENRVMGPGWEDTTQQGPQISREQQDIILGYVEKGRNEGATLVTGGTPGFDRGYFVEPTVFADVSDDMTIAKEEIFGPVMSILKYSDVDEVIARANDTEYGLAAAVYTSDYNKAHHFIKHFRAGTVWVNCYDVFDAATPFGGFKASGIGRELGEAGLDSYLEKKSVVWARF